MTHNVEDWKYILNKDHQYNGRSSKAKSAIQLACKLNP